MNRKKTMFFISPVKKQMLQNLKRCPRFPGFLFNRSKYINYLPQNLTCVIAWRFLYIAKISVP